jgi:hypothetical protein
MKATLFALSLTVALAGCEGLLEVRDPDIVTPDILDTSVALPTIRAAAIGDFALAYSGSGADGSGGTEGIILMGGLLGDELINTETFPTRIEVDNRGGSSGATGTIQASNGTVTGWFRTLSRARRSAEFAAGRYRALAPDTTTQAGFPEVLSLAGFTYLFFAENWCSGVPFSTANADGSLVYGAPLSTMQILDSAQARFTQALVAATALNPAAVGAATRQNMIFLARVGLGRTLLDKGLYTAARDTVVAVTGPFAYLVFHSVNTARQFNGVFQASVNSERYGVADREGGYAGCTGTCTGTGPGVPWRSAADPRTPFLRTPANDVGFDNATPQFDPMRYGDLANGQRTPIPLATDAEARLIEAEAALSIGDTVTFLARHNGLRGAPPAYLNSPAAGIAPVGPMPNLNTTGANSDSVLSMHFQERGRWLWLTGHRLWDMRRQVRAVSATPAGWGRPVASVWPGGNYLKQGFPYGTSFSFPVPQDELNNPQAALCSTNTP